MKKKVRQIHPPGVKHPTDPAEKFLVFKLSGACDTLHIPWAADEHNPRGLMERLKAEAPPKMLKKIEKELGLSYRPDGTPFQDPAKPRMWTPKSFNKWTWFSGWPVPYQEKETGPTLAELEAESARLGKEIADADARIAELDREIAELEADAE